MPLYTQLTDTRGRARAIPWSWEDRCILRQFVYADGGMEVLDRTGEWTFVGQFGFCQVDTHKVININPGAQSREWRSF